MTHLGAIAQLGERRHGMAEVEGSSPSSSTSKEHRMMLHANARLSVKGRELLVDRILVDGWSLERAAEAACAALGLKHIRARPYRPRTNGKAERFIRTLPGGWAYGAIYASSAQRTTFLSSWLISFARFVRAARTYVRTRR